MGVKLKMLSAYHPETNSSSEQSNKTIILTLCYHIEGDKVMLSTEHHHWEYIVMDIRIPILIILHMHIIMLSNYF